MQAISNNSASIQSGDQELPGPDWWRRFLVELPFVVNFSLQKQQSENDTTGALRRSLHSTEMPPPDRSKERNTVREGRGRGR